MGSGRRIPVPMCVAVLGLLAVGGCGSGASGSSAPAPKGACPTAPVAVVVSVDQWGDIVGRLGGDCTDVTTIITGSSANPHDYEPTPSDTAKFTGAKLVVLNGLDYDPWAAKAVDTLDPAPKVVDGGKVVGLKAGANPHLWYSPDYVYEIADAVTAQLRRLAPEAAGYLDARRTAWRASMQPYDAEIAKIKPVAVDKTYGATEGVFDYMARAVGLRDGTPEGYRKAAANESDPSPGDVNGFEQALANEKMTVLVYNTQTEGAGPAQIRVQAEAAKVPIVEVTETVPRAGSFVAWQLAQLRHLASALGA